MSSLDRETTMASPFRSPTAQEAAILRRLLTEPFPGRDAIAEQLSDALVRELDVDGSLEFKLSDHPPAVVERRIPVEAEIDDIDGVIIHVLLHVLDGQVSELEIFREDPKPLIRTIDASDLRLLIL